MEPAGFCCKFKCEQESQLLIGSRWVSGGSCSAHGGAVCRPYAVEAFMLQKTVYDITQDLDSNTTFDF